MILDGLLVENETHTAKVSRMSKMRQVEMKKLLSSEMGVGTLGEMDTRTGWMISFVDCPWPAVDAEPACLHSTDAVWIESRNGMGGCRSCRWD